jgi:hypothetical protein
MRLVLWIAAPFESLRHVSDFEDFGYRPGNEIKANHRMPDRRETNLLDSGSHRPVPSAESPAGE